MSQSKSVVRITDFLDDFGVRYEDNANYVKPDGTKNGFSLKSDKHIDEVVDRNKSSKWINVFIKYGDERLMVLDIDDTTLTNDEIINKVKNVFGFIPPYTLSSTKQKPHFYIMIEKMPEITSSGVKCFKPCEGDLLKHKHCVVELRKAIVYNYNGEDIEIVEWDNIKEHFDETKLFKSIKTDTEQYNNTDINDTFKEAIELIKNSQYYHKCYDLDNIKVIDNNKFQFKATDKYLCPNPSCNKTHVKNNNHILVDCSGNGVRMTCRPNVKAVVLKNKVFKTVTKNTVCEIDSDDNTEFIKYEDVKVEFEKNNFYCIRDKKFYCLIVDKETTYTPHNLMEFSVAHKNLSYNEYKYDKSGNAKIVEKEFVPQWVKDKNRRQIIDFVYDVNPDYVENPNYINRWSGFDIEKHPLVELPEEKKSEIKDMIRTFFYNLGGDYTKRTEHSDYFFNWTASLINRPHIKQITVPLYQSDEEGAGKSSHPMFIGSILGDPDLQKYVLLSNGFDSINANFNSSMKDCFLCCLEELDASSGIENINKFKALTSAKSMTINEKYGSIYQIPNKLHLIITTNNQNPIPVAKKQRRLVISQLNLDLNNTGFFQKWYEMLSDVNNCRFIYDYFKTIDITNFNCQVFPISSYAKLLEQKPLIERFINENYYTLAKLTQIKSSDFFTNVFSKWCEKSGIAKQSLISVGISIGKNELAKNIFTKKETRDGNYYIINQENLEKHFESLPDFHSPNEECLLNDDETETL